MFFPATVTLKPCISTDAHHKHTYGSSFSPSCKYAKKDQVVKDQMGADLLTVAWLQFPLGTSVSVDDQMILPDNTNAPVVLVRTIHYPHNGLEMCTEVYLGKESV